MKIHIAWLQAKPGKDKSAAIQELTGEYVKRIARYEQIETHVLANDEGISRLLEKLAARTPAYLVLLDARGKAASSEQFAEFLREKQDNGTQQMLFVIGGAEGFSAARLRTAQHQLSLGKMTLPHELARVLLLEQIYRAFTILKGHPYHTGH